MNDLLENGSDAVKEFLKVARANGGITLLTQIGTMPTYGELRKIADGIYEFLDEVDERAIKLHNKQRTAEWKAEWVRRNEGYYDIPQPKKKERSKQEGFVYFLKEHHSNTVKIGRTINIKSRSSQFEVKLPFKWDFIKITHCNDCVKLEESLHAELAEKRVQGEWFDISYEDIDEALSNIGVEYKDVTEDWVSEVGE